MPRKRKYESKTDPDRRPAPKAWTTPLRVDGEIEGRGIIWDDVHKDEALALSVWNNGEITASIEKESE